MRSEPPSPPSRRAATSPAIGQRSATAHRPSLPVTGWGEIWKQVFLVLGLTYIFFQQLKSYYERLRQQSYLQISFVILAALAAGFVIQRLGSWYFSASLRKARRQIRKNRPDKAAALTARANRLTAGENDWVTIEDPDQLSHLSTVMHEAGVKHVEGGDPGEAIPLLKNALALMRKVYGPGYPGASAILRSMASAYHTLARYVEADSCYREALAVERGTLGMKSREYADILVDYATLVITLGDRATSKAMLREAIEIYEAFRSEDSPGAAKALYHLALIAQAEGDAEEAEALLRQSLAIYRGVRGEHHADIAECLSSLAALHVSSGDYAAAEPLLWDAVRIQSEAHGKQGVKYGLLLGRLGALYLKCDGPAAAESHLREAVEVFRRLSGPKPPDAVESLVLLACVLATTGRADDAIPLVKQAILVDDESVRQAFRASSENQRHQFLEQVRTRYWDILNLCMMQADQPRWRALGLEIHLRRKAIGTESMMMLREAVLTRGHNHLRPLLAQLNELKMAIIRETLDGSWTSPAPADTERLALLHGRHDEFEKEIARQIPAFSVEHLLRGNGPLKLSRALPPNSALVEIALVPPISFLSDRSGAGLLEHASYIAFVVHARNPEFVGMLELGEAASIDRLTADFRQSMIESPEGEIRRDIVARPGNRVREAAITPGESLRRQLFGRIEGLLGDRKRLFISADGDLTRLPFETLPMENGRRLIDDYTISYLGCGRDLLRTVKPVANSPASPLVIADPEFDLLGEPANRAAPEASLLRGILSEFHRDELHFSRLPGTRQEGQAVSELLGVRPICDTEATEGKLKAECQSPVILHLATHGYFLENPPPDHRTAVTNGDADSQRPSGTGRLSADNLLHRPLLRSGIALAGANTWLNGGALPAAAEDGLLTAEDVAGLDLSGTELVALSACETGLGEVRYSEGVFGLRRSFFLAGAKTVIMSLWKVPDDQTRELMEDFYRRLLRGQGRAEALREAQLCIKARFPDPFYWGAFICEGAANPIPQYAHPADKPSREAKTLPRQT